MGRGHGRQQRGFGGGSRGRKRPHRDVSQDLSKKQRSHLKQFGEIHPADERDVKSGQCRIVQDNINGVDKPNIQVEPAVCSSDSDDEPSSYQTLLSTFSVKSQHSSDSDSEEEESGKEDVEDTSEDEDEEADLEDVGEEVNTEDNIDKNVDENDSEEEDDEDNEDEEMAKDDYRDVENEEDDEAEEEVQEEEELILKESDPFTQHFEKDLDDDIATNLSNSVAWQKQQTGISGVGRCVHVRPNDLPQTDINVKEKDLIKLHVKKSLTRQAATANKKHVQHNLKDGETLTKFQHSLFSIFNSYQDLYFPERSAENGEEIRLTYCLHALNHVIKTRSRVIAHNAKIKSKKDMVPDDYRDQGLTRPKVLIVVPFRDSALRIINIMTTLLTHQDQSYVSNKKRFQKEFSNPDDIRKGLKPEDFEATFVGNTDDHFRIGVGIAKKSLKLYTPFYSADIIIATPLGLRTVIGAEGDAERDFDFLSSIELLIFDQADIFFMQNWDHIVHLMAHLHVQPKESHGVDFSRVRMWTLNGWSKLYRQTLIFCSVVLPEINAIFNKHCHNFSGKLQLLKSPTTGSICHIVAPLPQVFHRITVNSYAEVPDARFEFFKTKLLPQYKDASMSHTLIIIPSYFDFVRLRNYLKKEEIAIQKLCEYTTDKSIRRARSFFYHGRTHFLLFTERLHFYRRFVIRGIRHLIFYDLPTYPHFYSEIANMTIDPKQKNKTAQNFTCEALYTKYDVHKLSAIVGTERAAQMVHADKGVHMFITGDT